MVLFNIFLDYCPLCGSHLLNYNLLIISVLLHRQLLTTKQLCCWLGNKSVVLKSLSCICWCRYREVPEMQTLSVEGVAAESSVKMAYRFSDLGIFSILLSLTASILFFSSKETFCCWQELCQFSSTLVPCDFSSWNLLTFQRVPLTSFCFHHLFFPSMRISVFFYFVTPCLKEYPNYTVILAFFFFNFIIIILTITCCFLFWPLK